MPKQTPASTFSMLSPYDKAEQYLSQAEGLNLALWTSSDVHEQIKPVCSVMSDLLRSIEAEIRNMRDENKGSGL